jgi:uncharacterized protein (TIGR02246 family)
LSVEERKNLNIVLRLLPILVALTVASPASAQSKVDEAAIRKLAERWELAWNQHDMHALAALFTVDADFVNVGARHWKGREEIEVQHAARMKQFIDSLWTTRETSVQFLTPSIVLVHVAWALKGDKDPDGTQREPREGLFTWVVLNTSGEWLIRSAQNTNRGNLPAPVIPK